MPSSPPSVSIQDLDSNFQAQTGTVGEEGLRWVDARSLTVEGLGWPEESAAFCRFPDRSEGVLRDAMWQLSRYSAGVCIRFVSNMSTLAVRWSLRNEDLAMAHMPATGVSGLDLYVRDPQNNRIRWAAGARPEKFPTNLVYLLQEQPKEMREYFLYLPLYNGVSELQIGVNAETIISPAPPRASKPICFYGASIVQGTCASRPGMALTALLGRRFERAVWNFGFSGNSHAEPEIAALLAELDPAVYVIGPAPSLAEVFVLSRLGKFLQILREARLETPIVLVENAAYQDAWTSPARNEHPQKANAALRRVFEKQQAVIGNLHYIEDAGSMGEDGEATVDGTHPTDVGFLRLDDALAPRLEVLL